MTGGIIEPPEDAAASTPPANVFEKPRFSIMGIVKTPVDRTFTIGPPEIVPNIADETTAACAGPPRKFRVKRKATFINERPPAEAPNKDPRTRYGKIVLRIIFINRPSIPVELLTKMSWIRGRPSLNNRGSPASLVTRYLLKSSAP